MNEFKNVLGGALIACSISPLSGFYRDGCCKTGAEDAGTHTVCAKITDEFLEYTKSKGNNLSTPIPAYQFPGLKEGDFWCLCALRWKEALMAGKAPKVKLEATHEKTLEFISLEELKKHAIENVDRTK
tara:strand:+ start:383 stop:766 length:384 start_codon:yes stop_codon:yes gene_type:complete